jgi:superfamily II DNA or RNA helicase
MPDLFNAIPGLLQLFTPELRQEAERLVEDDAVLSLDINAGEAVAEVALDDRTAAARWVLTPEGWRGQSDAGDALRDLVLCALLVAARQKREAPTEADLDVAEEDFQEWLERSLGRRLTEGEINYVDKVEKRFRRSRQQGFILDQDMVRLHPRWEIRGMDPLEIWEQPPRTLRQFWSAVAAALDERGLAIPRFMLGAAGLAQGRERLAALRRKREAPRWSERIRKVARELDLAAPPAPGQPVERVSAARVVMSPSELRPQVRVADEPAWITLGTADLEARAAAATACADTPLADALLLRVCAAHAAAHGTTGFRLESAATGGLLSLLGKRPEMLERLVSLDDRPFQLATGPWRWRAAVSEAESGLTLSLCGPDGSPVEGGVWAYPMPDGRWLYAGKETLADGPHWFGSGHQIKGPVAIPLAALESADGIRFLQHLGVPPPDELAAKIHREALQVRVRAGCLAKSPTSSTEHALLRVEAVNAEGQAVERLRSGGWDELPRQRAHGNGQILLYDRSSLGAAAAALEEFRSTFDPEHQGFRVRITRQFPEQFHQWAGRLPESVTLEPDEALGTILADPLIARVKLEAAQSGTIDWFDLKLLFEVEGADLSAGEIRRLVAARGGFVRLADGTWKRVELRLSESQQEMMDHLGVSLEELGAESHRLHWRQLAEEKTAELLPPNAWRMVARRLALAELEQKPEVPDSLNLTLRPYQVEGYQFLAMLTNNGLGGILADDMGLGKTVQSIAWILWLREQQGGGAPPPALVVCPKSVLDVWGAEFAKAAPGLVVQILRDRDEFDLDLLRHHLDVLVINYAQLRGASELLKTVDFLAVILDEGQQIKNPDSQTARAARQLRAKNRLVLTGTPLENRLLDLWSLMTFATPGALGDRAYFQRHFDRRKDTRAAARLSARLRPFLLRRAKSEVARDLPPRSEEAMLSEMPPAQARAYQDELARAQRMVLAASTADSFRRSRFAILQALTRLRQICCHPRLTGAAVGPDDSAKLVATLELLEELHAEGHKVLVFSQFVRMLEILRERVTELGIPHHWLTGATQDRASVVRAFQEDPDPSVFLLSLKAGGAGLNLTAASYVILYDPWWNPAVEAQAIDRAHRIGQTQPVMAYRMITKNTIEEKILTLQQKKRALSANVLGDGEFTRSLERDDINYLFDLERQEEAWQRELRGE